MDYLSKARTVIELEVAEIERLAGRIGQPFIDAVELLRRKGYEALRLPEGVAEWGIAPVR